MFQVLYGPPTPAPIENRHGGDFATREKADARAVELREAGYEARVVRCRLRRHPSRDSS